MKFMLEGRASLCGYIQSLATNTKSAMPFQRVTYGSPAPAPAESKAREVGTGVTVKEVKSRFQRVDMTTTDAKVQLAIAKAMHHLFACARVLLPKLTDGQITNWIAHVVDAPFREMVQDRIKLLNLVANRLMTPLMFRHGIVDRMHVSVAHREDVARGRAHLALDARDERRFGGKGKLNVLPPECYAIGGLPDDHWVFFLSEETADEYDREVLEERVLAPLRAVEGAFANPLKLAEEAERLRDRVQGSAPDAVIYDYDREPKVRTASSTP